MFRELIGSALLLIMFQMFDPQCTFYDLVAFVQFDIIPCTLINILHQWRMHHTCRVLLLCIINLSKVFVLISWKIAYLFGVLYPWRSLRAHCFGYLSSTCAIVTGVGVMTSQFMGSHSRTNSVWSGSHHVTPVICVISNLFHWILRIV